MASIRFITGPAQLRAIWQRLLSLSLRADFSLTTVSPAIANGTTAGKLKTTAAVIGRIAGVPIASKGATDDLWDLTGQTTLDASTYKAFWLLIAANGTASIAAGTGATTAALALAALPQLDNTKCVFGVYVAGPSTNFSSALGAQGTIYNGIPDGVNVGGSAIGVNYLAAEQTTLVKG